MKNKKLQIPKVKNQEEAIEIMHKLADAHNVRFCLITLEDFSDCPNVDTLSEKQINEVLDFAYDALSENSNNAIDETKYFFKDLLGE